MADSTPPSRPTSPGQLSQPLSEETVRQLLAVQQQQITARLEEVKRDNAEINLNKSVAQQSIEAQERDRKHEREEVTKRQKTQQNFVLIALFIILIFSGYAMSVGQSGLVLDLVKILVGFIGGMGYWAWRYRKKESDDE